MPTGKSRLRRGFTLIEMMIVMAIITIIISARITIMGSTTTFTARSRAVNCSRSA